MAKHIWLWFVAAMAAVTAGCLQKDVTQTWYLDGETASVIWSVLEDHVRSDARDAVERHNEESTFVLAAQRENHPVARGFLRLGFSTPRTRVLRDAVPYSVLTESPALRIDVVGQRILLGLSLSGTSTLTKNGGTWEWKLTVRKPSSDEHLREPDDDVSALIGDLDSLTVVLTAGRFDEATGFTLSGDHRAAKIVNLDEEPSDEANPTAAAGPMVLRLRWTTGG
jgi:hypothetical protein